MLRCSTNWRAAFIPVEYAPLKPQQQ